MDYLLRLSIPRDRGDLETLIDELLFLSPALGSEESPSGDGSVRTVYFEDAAARDDLAWRLRALGSIEVTAEDRLSFDWLEHYEQSLQPMEIGERFLVVPSESLIPSGTSRIAIVVPQERAFGTGSHETTSLCLRMLESIGSSDRLAADVGTGSGILAMAMALLGVPRVIAFDSDFEAIPVLDRNLARNRVDQGRVFPFCGTLDALRDVQFDLVTMNIIPEVIIPMLPLLSERMRVGGRVIVSGILRERRDEVVFAAADEGIDVVREAVAGDWWCGEGLLRARAQRRSIGT
ncbi:MAG TPA: 50S ribosomal protein L11 methyltransferase [Thermoanaerobaculia bacterium]|nr:50S ribosomal protein L11 methyltransferase [Thermoanaerobaculia bacterium]